MCAQGYLKSEHWGAQLDFHRDFFLKCLATVLSRPDKSFIY